MAVQLILKNSTVEDKRPTPAQLANGEISLNYNEEGPFVACKDTAGNIQSLGGVKFSDDAPGDPITGAWWYNTSFDSLFVYDGDVWQTVGGGGGGGGTITAIIGSDGIDANYAGTTVTLDVDLDSNKGLYFEVGKLAINVGANLSFDVDGKLQADIDALSYKGTIDLTSDPVPPGGNSGDAFANTGTGAMSAAWQSATGLGATTVSPGDLVIKSPTAWSYVPTGGIEVQTDLGIDDRDSQTLDITSSTGTDVTIPAVTDALAGLMTAADKTELDLLASIGAPVWDRNTTTIQPKNDGDTVVVTAADGTQNITLTPDGGITAAEDAVINEVIVGRGGGSIANSTALGNNALQSNTSGNVNTAVGEKTLEFNTTGSANTAVGRQAVRFNDDGISNVGVGSASLYKNASGNRNTALGTQSLTDCEGSENTGVGDRALLGVTTGSNNVAIGELAGQNIQTGSNNTILGGVRLTVAEAAMSDTIVLGAGATERARCDDSGDWTFIGNVDAESYSAGAVPGIDFEEGSSDIFGGSITKEWTKGLLTKAETIVGYRIVIDTRLVDPTNADYLVRMLGNGDYTFDWGDGNIQTETKAGTWTQDHTYSAPGQYTVTITLSNLNSFIKPVPTSPYEAGSYLIKSVTGMSSNLNQTLTQYANAWQNCINMISVGPIAYGPNNAQLSNAFVGCTGLVSFPFEDVPWSQIANLNATWSGCTSISNIPQGPLNLSNNTTLNSTWLSNQAMSGTWPEMITTSVLGSLISTWRNCYGITGEFPFFDTSGVIQIVYAWENTSISGAFPALDLGECLSASSALGGTKITSWPSIDMPKCTSFVAAWSNCKELTSWGLSDMSSGEQIYSAWAGCSKLTAMPAGIAFPSTTTLSNAWSNCTSLTDFPANAFDTTGTLVGLAFNGTFTNCALTAASVENILVSLDANGQSDITLGLNGGTNAGKSTWTAAANTAYDSLIAKGWTIQFNT